MRSKEAEKALRLIAKAFDNPRLKPNDGDQLRKVQREMLALARSGKLERRRLFRAIQIMSRILIELL